MEYSFGSRLKHAWNAFMNRDPTVGQPSGSSYFHRPDRPRLSRGNERSIVTSVYNRIALDVAAINIRHCKLDEQGRFSETINSKLNKTDIKKIFVKVTSKIRHHQYLTSSRK